MKYSIILSDPPWAFKNWSGEERARRGSKFARANGRADYPVLKTEEIAAIPVHKIAAKNCALFLWATYPKLQDAMRVIEGWGFTYKTCAFTWVKTRVRRGEPANLYGHLRWHSGLGYWTRQNPELCLLATRGAPKRISKTVQNLAVYPLGRHSAKPPEIRERIAALMGDLPRVELFARPPVPFGWDAIGNEVDGKDIREVIT